MLGGLGPRIAGGAPPIPARVVLPDGRALLDGDAIRRGQAVWQSMGGQEVGSIWGHGAYVAPDWTADWLHREALAMLDGWARAAGAGSYAALAPVRQAAPRERLARRLHADAYDPATGAVTVGPERAAAFQQNLAHHAGVFGAASTPTPSPPGTLTDPAKLRDLAAFSWWTRWAAVTRRPGADVSYTPNWPHEPLVGSSRWASSRPGRRSRPGPGGRGAPSSSTSRG